jgi:hypothetical protein
VAFFKHIKSIQGWIFPRLRLGIFSQSIPRQLKFRINIVESLKFDENSVEYVTSRSYFPVVWISDLKKCSKYGGYRKVFNKYYWSHRKLRYFDFNKKIYGGIPKIINNAQLCSVNKIDYYPNAIEGNNVSKYTFKIERNKSHKFDIDNAIAFNFGGANSFQHFMQDCLPVINASRDLFIQNPEIAILLPEPVKSFGSRDLILKWLGINNKVINTNFEKISVYTLYFWRFKPFAAKYSLPNNWYKNLFNQLNFSKINLPADKLVLITRNEKSRNFSNIEEITNELKLLSKHLNLDLIVIDSSRADVSYYKNTLGRAKIIIAMHGGASYNLVFAHEDCLFFEFLPMQNTNSTINFVSGLGIRYIPVPINFSLLENNIRIDPQKIKQIGLISIDLLRLNS